MKQAYLLLVASLAWAGMGRAEAPKAANWVPPYPAVQPMCKATNWNQTGALNSYICYDANGVDKGYVCGCDPLAWGQVLTYHALNHGFPAAGWEPTPQTGTVRLGPGTSAKQVERTTYAGPYEWEKIRDQSSYEDSEGKTVVPVGRLMWDLGILGHTQYGQEDNNTTGTCWPDALKYFGYADLGYRYSEFYAYGEVLPNRDEIVYTLLRTALQAGAPVTTSVFLPRGGHMVVTDGFAVDEAGKTWFHVDKGWGEGSNEWWDLSTLIGYMQAIYTYAYPKDLGNLVAGRVALPNYAPIAGATVVLSDGQEARVATTDEAGCYLFTNLPELSSVAVRPENLPSRSYTVTVLVEGCDPMTRQVTLHPFVDDDLRTKKQDALEAASGKDAVVYFPVSIGSAVADFVVTPVRYFSAEGTGSGRSWADAAKLSTAALAEVAGGEARLAAGTYALSEVLQIPQNTRVKGGFSVADGSWAAMREATTLSFSGNGSYCVEMASGSVLEAVRIVGNNKPNVAIHAEEALAIMPQVQRCLLSSAMETSGIADNVRLTCCAVAYQGLPTFDGCVLEHCSFYWDSFGGKDFTDEGGHRMNVANGGETVESWLPTTALPCPKAAEHVCPEVGLDGRALNRTQGAIAPENLGYSVLIY